MIPWYWQLEFQLTICLLTISSTIIILDKLNRK